MKLPSDEMYYQVKDEHYPYDFPDRTFLVEDLKTSPNNYIETHQTAIGRIIGKRQHSNYSFYDLEDQTGSIQVITQNHEDETEITAGDIVAASGVVGLSRSDEISIFCDNLLILSKSLEPLRRHQFNSEHSSGQRFLDLMTHKDDRDILLVRSSILRATRNILETQGLIEIETPIVNTFYNGGVAKPFKTYVNALKKEAFLRVTSELYLKQIVASGIEGVYEITKQFRNEGLGPTYNPEFTVCEAYCAYKNDVWVMDTVEEIANIAGSTAERSIAPGKLDRITDITEPWERISMFDAVCRAISADNISIRTESDVERIAHDVLGYNGDYDGALQALFKKRTERNLIEPTFVTDLPESLTPMAKRNKDDNSLVKKVMFFAGGIQMGDGCYEENNPRRQYQNFVNQSARHEQSGFPSHPRDPDFMSAINHAIPPMGGIAIGFDRLIMLATGKKHIKDVLSFKSKK